MDEDPDGRYKCSDTVAGDVIYITRGLIETLLRFSKEKDPDSTTIPLAITRAADLPEVDLPDEMPVFTHFYMPGEGESLNAVFGVNLTTPAGQTPGVFVSHPRGDLRVTKRDDLREVVIIGVPPWEDDSFEVFGRKGSSKEYAILDIEPPEEVI